MNQPLPKTATHPVTGEQCELQKAQVWVVDPTRGDLYVLMLRRRDVLVQLIDGGTVNRPELVQNREMGVMVDYYGNPLALPDETDVWGLCKRLAD